eukprot:TRINITY_DN4828_c0_g1_i3.p2 TRINITY_DN4828_c0_g1~~TRINITY_DN4828_c0_g1_i3.p2  ORF type:complete len:112 (-),score=11.55 TRINITY_DN4828_c0_g1_i3:873-1208(-)
MKKGVFHIKLEKGSGLGCSYGKDGENCGHLCDRCKSLFVVDAIFLSVAKGHKPCLVSIQSTICLQFDRVNPFTPNRFNRGWAWNNNLCLVMLKSIKFFFHSLSPAFLLCCL